MAVDDAIKCIVVSLQHSDHWKLAISQLYVFRKTYNDRVFGGSLHDSPTDFLTSLYFNSLISDPSQMSYATIGANEAANDMCKKFMVVNSQIRHSLKLLKSKSEPNDLVVQDVT